MSATSTTQDRLNGGEFLIKTSQPQDVFIPEEFGEEARMMREAAREFVEQEILPLSDKIDRQEDWSLITGLLKKSGDLGLLGLGVPEAYGGQNISFNTGLFIGEEISKSDSFSLAIGVQTSIGIAPILLYGNDEQKAKYLPKMVSGDLKTCYCLTEPDAGSDANSGKTKAMPTEDGKNYIINGQKMWITNAGYADIFIVFARIEEDKNLSAFIVEKAFGGITLGEEEKKMGIKGSSTRQVFFNDVKVPAENLLGERNGGFKIAVNVLNTGRIKLGNSAVGVSKKALKHAVTYAIERKQFGKSIAEFGAIKHKLANIAAKTFALESAVFRTGHNIDLAYDELIAAGKDDTFAKSQSVVQYAVECAILKVFGSEIQAYSADECVQIFGGMGFSADAPAEKIYRDARITRIFEGTNEINRMLIVDMLLRKAMKGELDLMGPAQSVAKELTAIPDFGAEEDQAPLAKEKKVLANLKKAMLVVAGAAVQKFMQNLKDEQEVLINIADMIIQIYALESVLLRTEKLAEREPQNADHYLDMMHVFMYEAIENVNEAGKEAVYSFAQGDEQRMMLMGLKRFTKAEPFNLKNARRRIADRIIERN